jgi:hypothetical protein
MRVEATSKYVVSISGAGQVENKQKVVKLMPMLSRRELNSPIKDSYPLCNKKKLNKFIFIIFKSSRALVIHCSNKRINV